MSQSELSTKANRLLCDDGNSKTGLFLEGNDREWIRRMLRWEDEDYNGRRKWTSKQENILSKIVSKYEVF